MIRWSRRHGWLALACLTIAGCNILGPDDDNDVGRFLTLSGNAADPPTAFFVGTITRDAAGCYRISDNSTATVIWPRGATATKDESRILVHEATGKPAGEVPGAFNLVGHRVTDLLGQSISAETRNLATQHCPGTYFVIADIIDNP